MYRCSMLDYLEGLLSRMSTPSGKAAVIDAIKRHFSHGHQGLRCPDPENRYY
jgi:hypothetical protein